MCILPASFSLFARADEARKDALLLALSENTSESKGEASISGEGYIVKFKDNVPLYELEALLKDHKYSLLAESDSRLFAVVPETEDFFEKHDDIIEYYEADHIRGVSSANDPLQATDFESLGIYDARENASPDSSIIVAVLDTGVYRNHEDLSGAKILSGYDAVAKTANVKDDSAGHGTGVIGIIAATANNSIALHWRYPGCPVLWICFPS